MSRCSNCSYLLLGILDLSFKLFLKGLRDFDFAMLCYRLFKLTIDFHVL